MQVYQIIMDDIVTRTNGEYEKMTYTEKVMVITIMKEIKEQLDRYMREQYPAICAWSAIPIDSLSLSEKEPDLSRFKEGNFVEQFNKLMGV